MPGKSKTKKLKITGAAGVLLQALIGTLVKGGKYVAENAEVAINAKSGDVVIRIKKEV